MAELERVIGMENHDCAQRVTRRKHLNPAHLWGLLRVIDPRSGGAGWGKALDEDPI